MDSKSNRLNDLLYEILIMGKKGLINEVADMVGMAYTSVHDFTKNLHKNVPPKIIKAAFLVTGDVRLKRELEPEGYELVPKKEALKPCGDHNKEISDVNIAVSDLHRKIREALEDGKITKHEKLELLKQFEIAKKEMAEVGELLKSY